MGAALAVAIGGAAITAGRASAQAGAPTSLVINYTEAAAARVGGNSQITVYAMLVDANGQPVPGARVQSAQMRLGAGETPVTAAVDQSATPIAAMVVFDASGSMVGERASAARTAVIDFVNTKQPDDQIGVIQFNDTIVFSSDFTADRVAAISSVSFNPAQRTPGSCLWDTLYEAVSRARRLPGGRRAIVLVTDGQDQTLPGGPVCSRRTLDDVLALAVGGGVRVPVYVLGLGNAQNLNPAELERLARETGGDEAITEISSEIGPRLGNLVAALRAEFSLRAEAAVSSGPHDLEVEVTLADGGQFIALGAVDVPATVFTPPTPPPAALPTLVGGASSASSQTPAAPDGAGVASAQAATLPPAASTPPDVSIIEARQNEAGDLVVRVNVQEHGAAVTAVIVLLDGQPLGTVPPGAFGGEITLPLGQIPLTEGSHTISVEAYDTGGQVARDQLSMLLRGAAPAAAQASETPSGLFTLSAPMSPSPSLGVTATQSPATATPEAAGVAPAEASPTVAPPADRAAESGPSPSPALMIIGLIVIAGAGVLIGLWWRARRAARYTEGALVEGVFRYDYYAPPPAGRLPPVINVEPTEVYQEPQEDRTALYVGDQGKARLEVIRSLDTEARVNSPYTLDAQRVTVGRDSSNDIVFAGDRFVSARHVRFLYVEGTWILEELGALNKTLVNGKEVTGRVFLNNGDLIELGPYTRMRFTTEQAAARSSPPPIVTPRRRNDEDDEGVTRIHKS